MGLFQLRQLPSLMNLRTLHLRGTQRTLANIPQSLDSLTMLEDLDLGQNELPKVPDAVYLLTSLKRLNLSDNCITEVSSSIGMFYSLIENSSRCFFWELYQVNLVKQPVFAVLIYLCNKVLPFCR